MAEGRVLVKGNGEEKWLTADSIILALGSVSNKDLLEDLSARFPDVLAVGDCVEPRRAKEAIHEGFLAGSSL